MVTYQHSFEYLTVDILKLPTLQFPIQFATNDKFTDSHFRLPSDSVEQRLPTL